MLPMLEKILPLLAAALFAYSAVVCLHALFRRRPVTEHLRAWPSGNQLLRVAGAVLLAGLLYQLAFVAAAVHNSPDQTLAAALQRQFYGNTDARHYIDLAEYGYGAGEAFPEQYLMIVFFPLFPLLVRVTSLFGVIPYWLTALMVQLPLACLAGTGLYALAHRHFGQRTAWWTLAFWVACPAGVFFWTPMTESLFLALCTWYIIALERRRWPWCVALGVLAGLTRAPGMLLCGLAAVWLWMRWRQEKERPTPGDCAAVLAPALGLGLYFLLNFALYGNWQQYAVYQKEHWNNALGLFTDTVAYLLRYTVRWWRSDHDAAVWLCLAAVLCILAQLLLLALTARKLPPAYLAYGLAYTAITTGVTWLISGPRYAAALFCLPMALAAGTKKHPRLRRCLFAGLAVCGVLYTWKYLHHGPIY